MKTDFFSKNVVLTTVMLISAVTGATAQTTSPDAHNEIVVVVDASRSFLRRQQEAIDRTNDLLRQLELRQTSVWQDDHDKVTVISLDAMPAVVWSGSPTSLKKAQTDGSWSKWLTARSDYSGCTDVLGGFRLATEQFSGNSPDTHKYLIVFSDLLSEPPLSTVTRCARAQAAPPQGFPWQAFSDVGVSVFWTPANSALLWKRAIDAQGLAKTFHLYSDSEAASVHIETPPVAVHTVTTEEINASRAQVGGFFTTLGTILAIAVGLLILLMVGAFLAARRQRSVQTGRLNDRAGATRTIEGRQR